MITKLYSVLNFLHACLFYTRINNNILFKPNVQIMQFKCYQQLLFEKIKKQCAKVMKKNISALVVKSIEFYTRKK